MHSWPHKHFLLVLFENGKWNLASKSFKGNYEKNVIVQNYYTKDKEGVGERTRLFCFDFGVPSFYILIWFAKRNFKQGNSQDLDPKKVFKMFLYNGHFLYFRNKQIVGKKENDHKLSPRHLYLQVYLRLRGWTLDPENCSLNVPQSFFS